MALERGRWQQENVFRFICIFTSMAPICGFVVFPFKMKEKKWVVFFLRWVFHWGVGYYLELCYCFFLVQEFLWHIGLHFFFFLWKHLRRQYTGCFLLTTVCGDFCPHPLRISSLLLSHYPVPQGAAWSGRCMGSAQYLLPASCLPGIWQDGKLPSKPVSAMQTI